LVLLGDCLLGAEGIVAARPFWEEALHVFVEVDPSAAEDVRARLPENPEGLDSNT
jgi:hypothetical protein